MGQLVTTQLAEQQELAAQRERVPTWSAEFLSTQMDDIDILDPDPGGAYARRHQQGLALAEADQAARERIQAVAASSEADTPPFKWEVDKYALAKLIPAPFKIMGSMLNSGHHRWGLVMYRVSYSDDAAWQNFLRIIKWCFHDGLQPSWSRWRHFDRMVPYLRWTTVEDRGLLEGASKETVRRLFSQWVADRTDERDGPGACRDGLQWFLPRYRYCLYIDAKLMNSMNVIVSTTFLEKPKMEFFGTLILVDARFGDRPPSSDDAWKQPEVIILQTGEALRWEPELDENGNNQPSDPYELIDGITTRDVGWMLVPVGYLFWLYNQLSEIDGTQRLALDQWTLQYRLPPDEYGPMAHDFDWSGRNAWA